MSNSSLLTTHDNEPIPAEASGLARRDLLAEQNLLCDDPGSEKLVLSGLLLRASDTRGGAHDRQDDSRQHQR